MNFIKNLKVRTKVLLAFGVVLAIMCIAVAFIVIANITTLTMVKDVNEGVQFQDELTIAKESFMEADKQANILYSIISSEARAELDNWVAKTEAEYKVLFDHIDANADFEKFSSIIKESYDKFVEWKTSVLLVAKLDSDLEEGRKTFASSGAELTSGLNAFMTYQIENGVNKEQFALLNKITDGITSFRIASRTFQYSFDETFIKPIYDQMDKTIADLEQYKNLVETTEAKDEVQKIIDIIKKRYKYTDDFVALNDESERLIDLAMPLGVAADEALDEVVQIVFDDVDELTNEAAERANLAVLVVIIVTAFVLVVALFVAFALSKGITRPLATMQKIMEQAGTTGNLNYSAEVKNEILKEAQSKDEIGQSMLAFSNFVEHIVYVGECLTTIANNDLTLNVNLLGSDDTIGNSLVTLLDNLNSTLINIASAADQVNVGSKQVAQTSVALSQGATEQASSIEQLSAAIEEISSQTKANAENANQVNAFVDVTKNNAEKGDKQMQDMLKAMKEINEASSNISKVIKVIDDIAFQTNILALNAAVEAARAGAAGRGFAVVAEEVRNLAARSASAAKETTEMIEGSMQKAVNGTKIANETASALKMIVEEVENVAALIKEIVESSNDQSIGIAQVNDGLSQVSHVVQTNAATSEESAAASEEMNSQSNMLNELVSKFQLKTKDNFHLSY